MKPYIELTKTGRRDGYGLAVLHLTLHHPTIKAAPVEVNSGGAGRQIFRAHNDEEAKPGSMEPIPEGRYVISLPVYRKAGETWPAGIGDRTMPLTPYDRLVGGRGAFEIHPDANRTVAPGSAGCPATFDTLIEGDPVTAVENWGRVAHWVRELGADMLYVNWGLGVVKLPARFEPAPEPTKPNHYLIRMDVNTRGLVLKVPDGLPAGQHQIYSSASGWEGKAVPR